MDGTASAVGITDFVGIFGSVRQFKVALRDSKVHYLNVPASDNCAQYSAILECVAGRPICVLRHPHDKDAVVLKTHEHVAQVSSSSFFLLQEGKEVVWTNKYVSDC